MTNGNPSGIICKLLPQGGERKRSESFLADEKNEKNLEKRWKKFLTKESFCDRISKLTRKGSEKLYLVNWITQRRTKHLGQLMDCLSVSEKTANENSWVINAESRLFKTLILRPQGFKIQFLRVWSWLRTNAGGVPNTCKSNGSKSFGFYFSGERVSNAWGTCLSVGDNSWKRLLIPHNVSGLHGLETKALCAERWPRVWLDSWWGNGLPSQRSVAGLRGWTATLGLRYGPDSYGRQQWGILHNGGNPDAATPREGRRFSDCKLLFLVKKMWR